MPMSCAAADWVKSRSRMMRSIFTTSPALIKCSPAPARPRSANTLPELGSSLRAFLFGILYLTAQLFEPLPDYFYLGFRCRDTSDAGSTVLQGVSPWIHGAASYETRTACP